MSSSEQEELTIRTVSLVSTERPGQEERLVTHVEVRRWADYSVPDSTAHLLSLIKVIENLTKQSSSSPLNLMK